MTTRIITREQARDMADQLNALGGVETPSEDGIIIHHPKGRQMFRAMNGSDGQHMLASWPDGLFDVKPKY